MKDLLSKSTHTHAHTHTHTRRFLTDAEDLTEHKSSPWR